MTNEELDRLAAEKVILVVIPAFPQYAADVCGRIWRLKNSWQTSLPKIVKPYIDLDGYPTVRIWNHKKYIARKVHSLVCMAFNGPRPSSEHETRHLNGIKTDNRPENLMWGTAKENCQDRIRHGTAIFGEKNHAAKLTEKDVVNIFTLYSLGWQMKQLAKHYNVAPATIEKILHKKTWKHLKTPNIELRGKSKMPPSCLKAKGVGV